MSVAEHPSFHPLSLQQERSFIKNITSRAAALVSSKASRKSADSVPFPTSGTPSSSRTDVRTSVYHTAQSSLGVSASSFFDDSSEYEVTQFNLPVPDDPDAPLPCSRRSSGFICPPTRPASVHEPEPVAIGQPYNLEFHATVVGALLDTANRDGDGLVHVSSRFSILPAPSDTQQIIGTDSAPPSPRSHKSKWRALTHSHSLLPIRPVPTPSLKSKKSTRSSLNLRCTPVTSRVTAPTSPSPSTATSEAFPITPVSSSFPPVRIADPTFLAFPAPPVLTITPAHSPKHPRRVSLGAPDSDKTVPARDWTLSLPDATSLIVPRSRELKHMQRDPPVVVPVKKEPDWTLSLPHVSLPGTRRDWRE